MISNRMKSPGGWIASLSAGLLLIVLAPGSGSAQSAVSRVDPGWVPWLGCWKAVGDGAGSPGQDNSVVCIHPAGDGVGVEFVTAVDDSIVDRRVIRADDRQSRSSVDGCQGWQKARFSDDGHRVYLGSEYVCPGNVRRTSSGLLAWVSPYEWMEVRGVKVRQDTRTGLRRYQAATPDQVSAAGLSDLAVPESMAVDAARMAAAEAVGIDQVVEASSQVSPDVEAAWLADLDDPLPVDGDALSRMADAGVSDRVIDVVVAVTYPDRFTVDRTGTVGERQAEAPLPRGRRRVHGGRTVIVGAYGRPYPWYDPFYYDPFYGSWGYPGYGYGWYGYYGPVIVNPNPTPDVGGKAVNGRGYTRRSSGSSSGSTSRTPPTSSSRPSASSGSSSAGSGHASSGGASRSGGYHSGGSTGRTARPRH